LRNLCCPLSVLPDLKWPPRVWQEQDGDVHRVRQRVRTAKKTPRVALNQPSATSAPKNFLCELKQGSAEVIARLFPKAFGNHELRKICTSPSRCTASEPSSAVDAVLVIRTR